MSDVITAELFHVLRDLFIAWVVWFSYKTTLEASEEHGRWWAAWRGALWAAGLALFASATLGQPSCEDTGDGLRGGCESYEDNGYTPTTEQRFARFLFFALLLGAPSVAGAINSRPSLRRGISEVASD